MWFWTYFSKTSVLLDVPDPPGRLETPLETLKTFGQPGTWPLTFAALGLATYTLLIFRALPLVKALGNKGYGVAR